VNEEVNETDGSYNATETWLLSSQAYFEEYTTSVRKVDDQPNLMVVVALQGTVHGFYADQNDYDARNANAASGWAAVGTQLLARASAAAGVTLNTHPTAYSVDYDKTNGKITYQAEFNNRTLTNDTWETYNVSKKRSAEDYKTNVTVAG